MVPSYRQIDRSVYGGPSRRQAGLLAFIVPKPLGDRSIGVDSHCSLPVPTCSKPRPSLSASLGPAIPATTPETTPTSVSTMPRSSPSDSCLTKPDGSQPPGSDPKDPEPGPSFQLVATKSVPTVRRSNLSVCSWAFNSGINRLYYSRFALSPSELSGAGTQILGPSNMAAPVGRHL